MKAFCSGIDICMGKKNTFRWMDDRDMEAKNRAKKDIENICASKLKKVSQKCFCALTNRHVVLLKGE